MTYTTNAIENLIRADLENRSVSKYAIVLEIIQDEQSLHVLINDPRKNLRQDLIKAYAKYSKKQKLLKYKLQVDYVWVDNMNSHIDPSVH